MREPGDILLVACYELGHQPLSLASPLAVLRQAGYAPVAVDTSVTELPDEAIARARLVAIAAPMHTALRLGVAVAQRVRRVNPAAHICFYGLYATLNADYLLAMCADALVSGEYEQALLNLVQALEAGTSGAVEGVTTRAGTARPVLQRLPFIRPDRTTLPGLERYARLERDGELKLAGYVEATRGCLHTCRHCPITPVYRGRFFAVPREVVLEDIRWQVEHGAAHITFGDPDFLNGPGHALRIARAMHAVYPHVTFDATIKIEHILEHRALFPELRDLGCIFVVSAVESLSDLVLAKLAKGHTKRDVVEAVTILNQAGIALRPTFVPFTPWATLDDYVELLDFVAAHDLIDHVDAVQYAIRLLVPPGSALLDDPSSAEWLGPLDRAAFTYTWLHPDPRMDQLYRDVSALVETSALAGEDPYTTFQAIRALAEATRGRALAGVGARPAPDLVLASAQADRPLSRRQPAPRLTEPWFC
jgi:radical SAM superfamily enzyme YgiQ (UPF0313 family)